MSQRAVLPFFQRLSIKQTQYVLLIALCLGLGFSVIQIFFDYQNVRTAFATVTQDIISSNQRSARQAAFTFDSDLANQVVQGLMQYSPVYRVELYASGNILLAKQKRPLRASTWLWLSHSLFGKTSEYHIPLREDLGEVGILHVYIDNFVQAENFLNRTLVTVSLVLIANILLAILLAWVFRHLVTQPLSRITKNLATIDPKKPEKTRLACVKGHQSDELGQLVQLANQLLASIDERVAKEAGLNKTLEQKVMERTAALEEANAEIIALNAQLTAENMRMGAELSVTRQLQKMVLPKEQELEAISALDIAGFMEPATEVGGDYYDVLQHNGRIKIGIGDVTGHGLESGVLMMMVQTAVRALLANNINDPKMFLKVLNKTIYDNVRRMGSDKNLTLSLLDYHDGVVHLSGQHEEVILMRANGELELIDTLDLGFFIGMESDIEHMVAHRQIELYPGDGIVLYTDGITEAFDDQEDLYGLPRLCRAVQQNWHLDSKGLCQAVVNDVRRHIGDNKPFDDITLLVIKQKAVAMEATA